MRRINSKQHGFTLIEILVVITIIAMLTAVGLVSYAKASALARDSKRKSDMEQFRAALVLYRTDNGIYPGINAAGGVIHLSPTLTPYTTVQTMQDPRAGATNQAPYGYMQTGNPVGTGFIACAYLENPSANTQYCVTNP